ncbi:sensor histidine kinase [Gordonia terrae]|uniref:histidine kinase n=2 Tax=Gordonia terrae TaxID=2055 RepID=A0AAD0KBX1_9ACTN|nr:HAMP domain-containing sensor histidine kinase [Gordonia terrae]VTR02249.1 histidine kinase,HAMP domain-containing protein,histidine kinase [Clostridioides difficile]ANY26070.1 two-component sensor histidine kinase [Gordonia terrae]AWO86810.1 sensor histidine kinase [Gordonia terrae]VTS53913.1 Sensor protein srrB [Gordonia terrae]GAB41852.1 putative two-component histidine kinase [Gordonia terrae NBRC 100016]
MNDERRRLRIPGSFGSRLMLAQAIVIGGGGISIAIVALFVAPHTFHDHLGQARLEPGSVQAEHVEAAFTSSIVVSMSAALITSTILATAVSWFLARRVQQSVASVARSAVAIGAGNYRTRVPDRQLGTEFTQLSHAINQLAQRLDSQDDIRKRMLSDLAHELRTPLTTIGAITDAVEDGIRAPDSHTFDVVRTATTRLQRLAEDIATVSSADEHQMPLHPATITVNELLIATYEEAAELFTDAEVTLGIVTTASRVHIDVDAERMSQVLLNLLTNALRHSSPGQRVVVKADTAPAHAVRISVVDCGDGIPAQHLPHIFDRFYRTDSSRTRDAGGSGIGLTIARSIVEDHGGTLLAESLGTGHGATFTITLPTTTRRHIHRSTHGTELSVAFEHCRPRGPADAPQRDRATN